MHILRNFYIKIGYMNVDPVLRHAVEQLQVGEWL
jgi:hypothetical protein